MRILNVKVDNLSRSEILKKVEAFLAEDKFHQIATVNPEFILQAQKDAEFKNILNNCDLNIADGIGIWFAFLRYGKFLKTRMAGADLMEEILKLASINNQSVFLASYDGALSRWEEIKSAISRKYPDLEIEGMDIDKKKFKDSKLDHSYLIQNLEFKIKNSNIVLCSFGAPDQEIFINSLKNMKDSKIKLAMGVGGSFDFLTGKIKRAPKCSRKIGLEWLWRFLQEPTYRAKRIFNAIIIFPVRTLFNK